MKQNLFFISIEEAKRICDKSQYCEATIWEKIKLNFRYIWCKYTRRYVIRNRRLSKFIEKSEVECLTPEELYNLKQKFEEDLDNMEKQQP